MEVFIIFTSDLLPHIAAEVGRTSVSRIKSENLSRGLTTYSNINNV